MDAQGSLDSLLGRLTSVLVDEAQLLGGIRGDVEFIKDEMESMNGLLLHLTEAQHRDHQVRAWMKQVAGLTRDCEGNVELYINYVGAGPGGGNGLVSRYLRWILFFLRTIPVRRRIASRIRELKVRSRDIGDRRLRYGVTVPDLPDTYYRDDDPQSTRRGAEGDEEDRRRRSTLFDGEEPPPDKDKMVRQGIDSLIKCLSEKGSSATEAHGQKTQPMFFSILGKWLAYDVAKKVYEHSFVASSFDFKAFIKWEYRLSLRQFLDKILEQVTAEALQPVQEGKPIKIGEQQLVGRDDDEKQEQLVSKLQGLLKGKRFLMVIVGVTSDWEDRWKITVDALLQATTNGCHPGSAIVSTTNTDEVATWPSTCHLIKLRNLAEFYESKARRLDANYLYSDDDEHVWSIFDDILGGDAYAMQMFLHLVYVYPNRTNDELKKFSDAFSECERLNKSVPKQLILFSYNELPSRYRSCLLYLTIFPSGHIVRAKTLARRWIAEGLITSTATRSNEVQSALDVAEHYLDVLFIRGFVSPLEIGDAGKLKSFTIRHEVRDVITKIAWDVNFVEANLPTNLAHHLSIHNRIGLQASHSTDDDIKDIVTFLPVLAASSQWQLLKLLDLEGCKELTKYHLQSICQILLLKYLSLRNTDVTELPEQLKELQCLETLDIRQTKVRALAKKAIVLPLLKYFLAGYKDFSSKEDQISHESFCTVRMPIGIQRMKNLETLSHVKVLDSDSELASITQLLKLKKLGVILDTANAKLIDDLFRQIGKLESGLRSLSILINRQTGQQNHHAEFSYALPSFPQFIERLNISGITSGLPLLIQEHHQLAKVTLTETYLKKDDLSIIGNLHALRCLKLQYKSYTECALAFKEDEFQGLNFLLVEGSDVNNISFVSGAAPKLERFVWSFTTMESLSGLHHLTDLKKLELNGDCNLEPVRAEIVRHPDYPYHPDLKHNPHNQRQEVQTVGQPICHPHDERARKKIRLI